MVEDTVDFMPRDATASDTLRLGIGPAFLVLLIVYVFSHYVFASQARHCLIRRACKAHEGTYDWLPCTPRILKLPDACSCHMPVPLPLSKNVFGSGPVFHESRPRAKVAHLSALYLPFIVMMAASPT